MSSNSENIIDVQKCIACNKIKCVFKFPTKTSGKGVRIKCTSCYYFKKKYTIGCMNIDCYNQITNISRTRYCYNCIELKVNLGLKIKRQKKKSNTDIQYYIKTSCTCKYKKEITPQEYEDKYKSQKGCCYWCNIKLTHLLVELKDKGERKFTEMVLDRKDNSIKQHTSENTVISCYLCNNMRGNLNFNMFSLIINILNGTKSVIDFSKYKTKTEKNTQTGSNSPWIPFNDIYDTKRQKDLYFQLYNEQKKKCAISGIKFAILQTTLKETSFMSPSVDRINSKDENGNKTLHTRENTHLILSIFNRCKLDMDLDVFNKRMCERFPKWRNGYHDIDIIFPDNHENNWLNNYNCKDHLHWISICKTNLIRFTNWVIDNKRVPVTRTSDSDEKCLANWWQKTFRNSKIPECIELRKEFVNTELYREYLMTNEEKAQEMVNDLEQFINDNQRFPSGSIISPIKERELASKFQSIKCRLDEDDTNINSHYNILREFMKSNIYLEYECGAKRGTTYHHVDQQRLKETCELLQKIGDGKVYAKTFLFAYKNSLTNKCLYQRHKYDIKETIDNAIDYASKNNIQLPDIIPCKYVHGCNKILNISIGDNGKIYHI